jgi:CheY-like chemotaxis protein
MLADMLTGDGHEATVAASGEEALAALRGSDFDAIFSDLRMPNLEGSGLFSAIKECRPDLVERVAFVTGDTLSPMASEFLSSCGRPHIEKPFSPDDVRRLLRKVAGG